jgi:hypothetical protein
VTFDQLIQQQRPHIERAILDLSRRHYLASVETEDFRVAVDTALERNDFELLRAFDGRSTWATYLNTVVTRQFYFFQLALWGKWRPSTAASRLGPAAILLEELIVRDRFTLQDAIDWMRTTHRVDLSRHRLLRLAEQLALPGASPARTAAATEEQSPGADLQHALRDALALVSPDDRLILEFRFRDHQPLTRIAAVLNTDARPLQRRIDTALKVIRDSLITQGIPASKVEELLRNAEQQVASPGPHWWDFAFARPSKQTRDR